MKNTPHIIRLALFSVTTAFVSALTVYAQTAPKETSNSEEEIVQLSKFEVKTTQGKGYTSTNSASGFKTNEPLVNIPQSVLVVTRDLIDDIGYKDMSDVLQFAGAVTAFRGERVMLRGRGASVLLDDAVGTSPFMDNSVIDSYQVLRGPTSVLYIGTDIAGTIIKTSKKPLSFNQRTVSTTFDDNGSYRADIDLTGPVGKLGDAKVNYRLVGAYQGGDQYFKNLKDDRKIIAPSLELNYKDTTVRVAYDIWSQTHSPNAATPITPSGKLYTGAGRDEAWFPKNAMEYFDGSKISLVALQRISPDWEVRFQSQYFTFLREGAVMIPGGVDFLNNVYYVGTRYNYQDQDFWMTSGDVVGKFEIAGFENQSAFGFAFSDERNLNTTGGRVTTSPFGVIRTTGAPGFPGVVAVPLNNPQLDNIRLPQFSDYVPAANPGSRQRTYRTNIYYQHTLDVIKERLSLVGGMTFSKIEVNNITNLSVVPPTAQVSYGNDNLYRAGIVFHALKGVTLYAMESTTFAPPSGRDEFNQLFPNVAGKGREVGIKTDLFDGRVSINLAGYSQELSNQAIIAGNLPSGISYFRAIGSTTQKGYDIDLQLTPLPRWQLVVTAYKGTVKDQTGTQVPGSYLSSFSVWSRYDFSKTGLLKGLGVGGGFVTIGGRTISTGGATGILNVPGNPASIKVDGGHLVNLFANYELSKQWSFRLNLNNVLDDAYPVGFQGPVVADPSPPRSFVFSTSYKF